MYRWRGSTCPPVPAKAVAIAEDGDPRRMAGEIDLGERGGGRSSPSASLRRRLRRAHYADRHVKGRMRRTQLLRLPVLRCRASFAPMLRVTALLLISIAMHGAVVAQNAKEDTVEVHGKSLQLSCAEWKRNQDGSWTSTGPLLVGTDTLTNVTLRGAKETNVLEAKCANGSSPSATPSRSDDATRHARHGHRHAEPTDGT